MQHNQCSDCHVADAFRALIDHAVRYQKDGLRLDQAGRAPEFTYLMTPKQFDRIRKICRQQNWPVPNCRGIRFDLEAVAHPLTARQLKDGCTIEEVAEILISAYCSHSQIGLNKPKNAQAIFFNAGRKVMVGATRYQAVAVVRVCQENGRRFLTPVTAFHATEAKVRSIS
ncbi:MULTISPECIES: hypothetical protein [Pseudomonas putida group]|uniref:hypothetical protein n=1 Tax=Pseudomonas putida group TaxID=136845 RepID=UPI0018A9F4DE|nr:hypothetical protein [Pseudomonas fulva]MBF8776269.1 hypothetical protein [Pseudomonas fulva]